MNRVCFIFAAMLFSGCGCSVDLYYTAPMTFGVRIQSAVQYPAAATQPGTVAK